MANPFDKFDEPSGNPFDRFDEPERPAGPLKLNRGKPSGGDSTIKRTLAGAALGVADIGNTALDLLAYLPGKVSPAIAQWNRTRNADFEHLTEQNKDSTAFNVGRVGGNIAATLPVGGAAAAGARALGASPAVVSSIASGGFRAGGGGMGVRALGGAITGGLSAGAIDPNQAVTGAAIGGALPGAVRLSGAAGTKVADGISAGSRRLMQSAIKPTIAQLKSGDAATAVDIMLKYGINPTKGGVDKLRGLIGNLNDQISDSITNSTAQIDKQKVLGPLAGVRAKFGSQVSPTADLKAIQAASDDFLAHPNFPGATIPIKAAQEMKQGTYRVLAKKYGQIGSADVEAQKALARGLKDEIAGAVPGISALNAEESKLIATLGVAERRALMELNKNPMGLAALAQSPASWAMFMADKSALFKSVTARMLNSSAGATQQAAPRLERRLSNPLLRAPFVLPVARGDGE